MAEGSERKSGYVVNKAASVAAAAAVSFSFRIAIFLSRLDEAGRRWKILNISPKNNFKESMLVSTSSLGKHHNVDTHYDLHTV